MIQNTCKIEKYVCLRYRLFREPDEKYIGTFMDGFADYVNTYVSKGWQPWGAPFTEGYYIIQAMVKYE